MELQELAIKRPLRCEKTLRICNRYRYSQGRRARMIDQCESGDCEDWLWFFGGSVLKLGCFSSAGVYKLILGRNDGR